MSWRLLVLLLAGIVLAACADNSDRSGDNNKFNGFYGGISTGMDGP